MCIIAIKPKGTPVPELEEMFFNNPDGAGFMFPKNGHVMIRKGFMDLDSLESALKEIPDPKSVPIVFHFRIATSGGVSQENTHPFPISANIATLKKTRARCGLGVAHNGVIPVTTRAGISDTMEYIASQLIFLYQMNPYFYKETAGKELILNATQSKWAFMDGDGSIETIGEYIEDDEILYSNDSYLPYINYQKWNVWDDYYYDLQPKKLVKLMWLSSLKHVVVSIWTNEIIDEADYYLMDEDGFVYEYTNVDYAKKVIGAKAMTISGKKVKFNKKEAGFYKVL